MVMVKAVKEFRVKIVIRRIFRRNPLRFDLDFSGRLFLLKKRSFRHGIGLLKTIPVIV